MTRTALDIGYLRERLRYDPVTGTLWWRDHPSMPPQWNARYAGTEAFTAISGRGYRHGSVDKRTLRASRVCWALHHGVWPEGEIDHEDHDTLNNRIGNLHPRSHAANLQNASRSRANTSGVTGVHWCAQGGVWRATIRVNYRRICLGSFSDLGAATRTRKAAEWVYGFHPNHGAAT